MGAAVASSYQTSGISRRPWVSASFTVAACLILCALSVALAAEPNYPELTGRIVDNAHLLNADDRAAIEAELHSLEATSTDQIAVVTVPSLDGYAVEDYSIGLARKWGIGQKDKDNGIVLLIAPTEHKVRIEVGRRLEPTMTDAMSKIIIENTILSKFRRDDFSGGIRDGVRDIKSVLLGDAEEVKRRSISGRTPKDDPTALIQLLLFLAIVAFVLWQARKSADNQRQYEQSLSPDERRRYQRDRARRSGGVVIIPGGSGDWGGGWSGGGDGGGGWSGGGGSFGGGGASGSW